MFTKWTLLAKFGLAKHVFEVESSATSAEHSLPKMSHFRTEGWSDMSPEEIQDFLDRPGRVGVIGTLDRHGRPHLVPVWFRFDGSVVTIWTKEARVWVQNLVRDPRVAFSVHDDGSPYAAVTIKGRASVQTGAETEIVREIRRISRRYLAAAEVEAYVEEWPDLRSIVTIQPERVVAWAKAG